MTNDPTEAIDLTVTQEVHDHDAAHAPATHRRGRRRYAVAGAVNPGIELPKPVLKDH